jgi:nucleotide-binding universal stress UspA family protein
METLGRDASMRTIVVGFDCSPAAERALERVAALTAEDVRALSDARFVALRRHGLRRRQAHAMRGAQAQ